MTSSLALKKAIGFLGVSIALIFLLGFFPIIYEIITSKITSKPVFWWESIGFMAMGIAWLTKGELIFAARKLDADMN